MAWPQMHFRHRKFRKMKKTYGNLPDKRKKERYQCTSISTHPLRCNAAPEIQSVALPILRPSGCKRYRCQVVNMIRLCAHFVVGHNSKKAYVGLPHGETIEGYLRGFKKRKKTWTQPCKHIKDGRFLRVLPKVQGVADCSSVTGRLSRSAITRQKSSRHRTFHCSYASEDFDSSVSPSIVSRANGERERSRDLLPLRFRRWTSGWTAESAASE